MYGWIHSSLVDGISIESKHGIDVKMRFIDLYVIRICIYRLLKNYCEEVHTMLIYLHGLSVVV
jgi:hypothetical protein